MRSAAAVYVTAVVIAGLAALGGAAVVYGGYDDSPGAQFIGLLLVLGAVALGARAGRRGV